MAATVLPPVRGRRRLLVLALLTLAGVASAAALGAAVGLVLGPLGPAPAWAIASIAGIAALGDLIRLLGAGPAPVAVGRQVPLEWGRLFSPETTAVLYGLRLGIGPLTILTSWTWWAALVLGGLAGPLAGAVVGATFHLTRVVTMVIAEPGTAGDPGRSRRLDGLEAPTATVAVVVTAGLALGALA